MIKKKYLQLIFGEIVLGALLFFFLTRCGKTIPDRSKPIITLCSSETKGTSLCPSGSIVEYEKVCVADAWEVILGFYNNTANLTEQQYEKGLTNNTYVVDEYRLTNLDRG